MNEFLAAPRRATVPNGYQVSVTLLFLLLLPLFLSAPCCLRSPAVRPCTCACLRVKDGARGLRVPGSAQVC